MSNITNKKDMAERIDKRKQAFVIPPPEPITTNYDKKIDKKEKCQGNEKKTLYSVTFNYRSTVSGKNFYPVTYRNFNSKLNKLTENLKKGDIVKYVPKNTKDSNYGLEAKIISITETSSYNQQGNIKKELSYKIKFTNPLLGNDTYKENINQYTEYTDKEGNIKKHETLIKLNKISLQFCEDHTKNKIINIIDEHSKHLVNFAFLRHKFPTKIEKKGKTWMISFWIPPKFIPNEQRQIKIGKYSIYVKIPNNVLPNQYYTTKIEKKSNDIFFADPTKKKKIIKKIRPIKFIPSWILAGSLQNIDKKKDMKDLISPPKNQTYTITNVKIIKPPKKSKNYIITNGEEIGYKNIKINVDLSLKLKTFGNKNESRKERWSRKFHDFIMSDSMCTRAMTKLGEGIKNASSVRLITDKDKEEEENAQEKERIHERLKDPQYYKSSPQFIEEIKKKAESLSESKIGGSKFNKNRKKRKKKTRKRGGGKKKLIKNNREKIKIYREKIHKIKKSVNNPEEGLNTKKTKKINGLKIKIQKLSRKNKDKYKGGKKTKKRR